MATVCCRQRHGTSVTDTHIPSQGQLARVGCLASCVRVYVAGARRACVRACVYCVVVARAPGLGEGPRTHSPPTSLHGEKLVISRSSYTETELECSLNTGIHCVA